MVRHLNESIQVYTPAALSQASDEECVPSLSGDSGRESRRLLTDTLELPPDG